MSKPLIGLTTTRMLSPSGYKVHASSPTYVNAVSEAGGLPILIPPDLAEDDIDRLLARLDGVLFTGGYDVDPGLYGGHPHPTIEGVDTLRDRLEIHLVRAMLHSGQPFFGICRGIQVVNVALGGSLYEHLPDQLPGNVHTENHDKPRDYLAHSVSIVEGSRISHIISNPRAMVNSLHHQGVRQLAADLTVNATAPDGLVEACEVDGHPFALAVQWHPEELLEHANMRKLFLAFIEACSQKAQP